MTVSVAVAMLLAGCTAPPAPSPPAHDPERVTIVTAVANAGVAVIDQPDAADRAEAISHQLFVSSPIVVVAPEDDPRAQATAARTAERWGVPMLLTTAAAESLAASPSSPPGSAPPSGPTSSSSASPSPSPAVEAEAEAAALSLKAEITRLHASIIATVGAVGRIQIAGVEVKRSGTVFERDRTSATTAGDVLVMASHDPANLAAITTARAAGAEVTRLLEGETDLQSSPDAITALTSTAAISVVLLGGAFQSTSDPEWSVAAARTGFRWAGGSQSLFPDNLFVALYGVPGVPSLGVLGEQGIPETIARANQVAAPYAVLGDRKVTPMLEIIATVAAAAPGSDGSYSNELPVSRIEPYVDAAAAANMPVILDLQPGRSDFLTQAKKYASLLERPNVGLALDPEWRLGATQLPLQQIGSVGADEVNAVSSWLAELVDQHGLPPKIFVLHQFRSDMLRDRGSIITNHPELSTVIHVDGQGSQPDKQATWNALHPGAPANTAWGWKNFYDEDTPMLTPEQTMAQVSPTPDLITYQ